MKPVTLNTGKYFLLSFWVASTVFSTLRRLVKKGMVIKEESGYFIDDPFFSRWIRFRRNV